MLLAFVTLCRRSNVPYFTYFKQLHNVTAALRKAIFGGAHVTRHGGVLTSRRFVYIRYVCHVVPPLLLSL